MKTYLLYLLIPIALVLFSQTSPKKEIAVKKIQTYNIDSLKRESDSIKQEIVKDINFFKHEVDSIDTITKALIEETKHLKKDTLVVTETVDSISVAPKKKGWIRKTIDKIKNK